MGVKSDEVDKLIEFLRDKEIRAELWKRYTEAQKSSDDASDRYAVRYLNIGRILEDMRAWGLED